LKHINIEAHIQYYIVLKRYIFWCLLGIPLGLLTRTVH